jgi:hypothetical protein
MSLKLQLLTMRVQGTEDIARVNRGRVRTASGGFMLLRMA